jgi:hypothetical protein
MPSQSPALRPGIATAMALVFAATQLAGCGSTPATSDLPGSGPSGATTTAGAGSPGATDPGQSAGTPGPALPTLTEPVEIGAALWDPARVEQGVVSLVEQLGIDIFTADGRLLRDAAGDGPPGMWLSEAEVRGLIEMGREDATAIAAGAVPFTLVDLYDALSPAYPGLSQAQLLDAYVQAYRAVPGDLVRESFAGHPFVPEAAFTRVHLWLLVLDGVLGRPQPASAATVSMTGRAQTARGPVAQVQLPPPSSALAQLLALDLTALPIAIARLSTLAYTLPVDFTISPTTVHEGHAGAGQPAELKVRSRYVPTPIVSPYTGLVLLNPNPRSGLDGLPVTFQSSQEATLTRHGSFSGSVGIPGSLPGSLGLPLFTDALGQITFTYTPRAEPAAGQGDPKTDVAVISAVVTLRDVLLHMYPAGALASLGFGARVIPVPLAIEWHEESSTGAPSTPGRWVVDLAGPRPGAGHYEGVADSLCAQPAGTDTWTATLIPSGSIVTIIDLSAASGFDTVSVSTAPSSDFDGLWFFRSDAPQTSAEVIGDETKDPPTVRGTARYSDTEDRVYTAAVTVHCAQVFR